MKVYIAGSLQNKNNVRHMMDALELRRHEITEDWTTHDDPEFGAGYASKDVIGIDQCDVFIIMLDNIKSSGKMFEMGYAAARYKHIIVVGDKYLATSVFFKLYGNVYFKGKDDIIRIMFIDEGALYDNITALIKYLK